MTLSIFVVGYKIQDMKSNIPSTAKKLSVHYFAPGAFSHLLNCYCKTVGKPSAIEKAYILKKVNFYKFRAFVTEHLGVTDFNMWYGDNKRSVIFTDALSQYINHAEGRTQVYIEPTQETKLIDHLINIVNQNNSAIKKALQAM